MWRQARETDVVVDSQPGGEHPTPIENPCQKVIRSEEDLSENLGSA
jgi:hypothetical protein